VWRAGAIATAGGEIWSRAPWPAADALFDLPLPGRPSALVVSGDAERRALVVDALSARGAAVREAAELTVEDLEAASVVALLGAADAPRPAAPWEARTMPAEAPAVLAAGRVLIAPRCATTFGLLPGTDHLAFSTHDDVVHYADAALSFPDSFAPFRVLGAIAAERHRASVVYARMEAELEAELTSSPRSAEPPG
jgi:hypothetical protein